MQKGSAVWLTAIHLAYGLVLPVAGLMLPLFLIPLALGGGLVAYLVAWRHEGRIPCPPQGALILALLTLVWSAVALAWTYDPAESFGRWLNLPFLLIALLLFLAAAQRYPAGLIRGVFTGLLLGFCVAAVIIAIEFLAGSPLVELMRGPFARHSHALGELNRGLSLIALLIWAPVAWLASRGTPLVWALPLLILVPALALGNLATALAVGAGLAGAALAWRRPRAGRLLVLLLPAALTLLGPPLYTALYALGLMEMESLPNTARYRVQIWWFVSERIYDRPLLGWGFDAARSIPDMGVTPYRGKESVIPAHPHQAFLQAWLELGLPGALLVIGWFALAWRTVRRLNGVALCSAVALTMALIAIAATAYGLWQGHTLAILVLGVGVFAFALRLLDQTGNGGQARRDTDLEAGPR